MRCRGDVLIVDPRVSPIKSSSIPATRKGLLLVSLECEKTVLREGLNGVCCNRLGVKGRRWADFINDISRHY